jgi:hypothetical protein
MFITCNKQVKTFFDTHLAEDVKEVRAYTNEKGFILEFIVKFDDGTNRWINNGSFLGKQAFLLA